MAPTDAELAAREPFWAACAHCGHIWPAFFAPLDIDTSAKLMSRMTCGWCGSHGAALFPASQADGVATIRPNQWFVTTQLRPDDKLKAIAIVNVEERTLFARGARS